MALTKRENNLSLWLFWVILLVGLLLPWVVAAWVKLSLQAQGSPTWPWSYFLTPGRLMSEAAISIYWALPFTGLALLSRYGLEKALPLFNLAPFERLSCIALAFALGVFRAFPLFRDLFWEFHPIVFLFPWFVYYGRDMLLGLLAGWLILGFKNRVLGGGVRNGS